MRDCLLDIARLRDTEYAAETHEAERVGDGAAAGALVWALSPWLTGHQEPWDADGLFYVSALVVAGSVAGAITPRPLWALYLGALTGQFGYELIVQRIGPLFLIGAVFLFAYSVIFLAAATLAGSIRGRLASRPSES